MKFAIQQLLTFREWQTEAEVHFSSYGLCPSLGVLAAAVARETRRVRIGTGVVIAPFAHPLRIAEEFGMVDILSGAATSPRSSAASASRWSGRASASTRRSR